MVTLLDRALGPDKLAHYALSGLLAGHLAFALRMAGARPFWALALAIGITLGVGAARELRQLVKRQGEPSWWDMAWNTLGAVDGALPGLALAEVLIRLGLLR